MHDWIRCFENFADAFACKTKWQVLREYRSRGLDFVMQVINEPTYLEDLTGLTELMKSADYSRVEWVDEFDNDEEFADM